MVRKLVAVILLLTTLVAAQDSLSDLRAAVRRLETLLADYPERRATILPDLQKARTDLINRLQADLQYFSSKPADPDSKKTIDAITREIADQKAKLASGGSAPAAAAAASTSPATPQPASPASPAAPTSPTATNANAVPAITGADAPATSTATGSATSASGTAPQAETTPAPPAESAVNIVPSSLIYWIDIAKMPNESSTNGCSNRPFAHDAGIWTVTVSVRPQVPDSKLSDDAKLQNYYAIANALFVPIARKERDAVTLVAGKQTYTGTTVKTAISVDLVFANLTLADAGDVIDQLSSHPEKIREAFRSAGLTFQLYRAEFSVPTGRQLDPGSYYDVLLKGKTPKDVIPFIQSAAQMNSAFTVSYIDTLVKRSCAANPARAQTAACQPFDVTVQVSEVAAPQLADLLQNANIDQATLKKTKQNLADLVNSQATKVSTNEEELKKKTQATANLLAASTGSAQGTTSPPKMITIIDDPCFTLSLGPSSASNFKPAVNFKTRYDYFSDSGAFFVKFKANGDGGNDTSYFQRLEAGGEASALVVRGSNGWQLSAGAVGHYSISRVMGMRLDEYKAGGRLELQPPFVSIFNNIPGSNSKPALSVEFVTSRPSTATSNAFDFNTAFAYTIRPTPQFSFDLNAAIAKSSQKRFAGDDFNSYFSINGRYSLFSAGDYLVKYECGRKDPDYRKVCGWQTGINLITGR